MSMTMLTILQIIEIFAVYIVIIVLMPALVFRRKMKGFPLSVRFMAYLMIGNFYIINLVYILQLLHISNTVTLGLFTVLPLIIATVKLNQIAVYEITERKLQYIIRLFTGSMGIKTFLRESLQGLKRRGIRFIQWIFSGFFSRFFDWILLFILLGYLMWIYGSNAFITYGYGSSDIPVHNEWINGMNDNQIFIKGVYPFGFHCLIYYMHAVFRIDTYVLLRLFWLVQTVFIHLVLLAFIKAICKTRFAAYTGVAVYIMIQLYLPDCVQRFYSSLPQEYGMLFILPGIYFAYAFFAERKKELDLVWIVSAQKKREQKLEKKKYLKSLTLRNRLSYQLEQKLQSTWLIGLYAVSLSLSLTVHFYDTMIVGIYCVAIALVFAKRFFNYRYFWRVLVAFALGILIAAAPMVIAYAFGTPLQGSLNWGMKVIEGNNQDNALKEEADNQQTVLSNEGEVTGNTGSVPGGATNTDVTSNKNIVILDDWLWEKAEKVAILVQSYAMKAYNAVNDTILAQVVEKQYRYFFQINLLLMGWLTIFVGILCLQRRFDYAATILSSIVYIAFLFFLLGCRKMGLPELMDYSRSRIFLVYSLPILWSLAIDAPIYAFLGALKRSWIMYAASFLLSIALGIYGGYKLPLRNPITVQGFDTNQAVTCLTNIIHDNKDFTWTIVSAGDETNMVAGHGRHYQINDFLNSMEYTGFKGSMYIPTKYVYFFIEKIPIDYAKPYENSGQAISEQGAERSIPTGSRITIYQGENRWIFMSKMYYWAKAYQKLFSNEMQIIYEDESFICYRIEQNVYSLNNFAIDYGYNLPENGTN